MKKIAQFMLALAVLGSMSTSSLFAQDYYETSDVSYDVASDTGTTTAMSMGWLGWGVVGLAAAGMGVIAGTHNSKDNTGHAAQ